MPTYPEFLAARFDERGLPCVVERVEHLSPHFSRVHVQGDALRGRGGEPCEVTQFRVTPTQFRHYTVEEWDDARGTLSMLLHRHGNRGPGEAWLDRARAGTPVRLARPEVNTAFRLEPAASYLLAGDATTLGMFAGLLRRLPADAAVTGAVEVPAEDVDLARSLVPGLDVVAETPDAGKALVAWLDERRRATPERAYLAGHAQTVQQLRATLRARHGMDRRAIATHVYWATGKAGL